MQGITGSGKTTLVRSLGEGLESLICSADDFFRRGKNYKFVGQLLPKAHASCRNKFTVGLRWVPDLIVLDNTNLAPEHYEFYADEAKRKGYEVILCRVLCDPVVAANRSKHKASLNLDNLTKAAQKFEQSTPNFPYIEIRTDR